MIHIDITYNVLDRKPHTKFLELGTRKNTKINMKYFKVSLLFLLIYLIFKKLRLCFDLQHLDEQDEDG